MTKSIATLITFALLATPAAAQTSDTMMLERMRQADTNRDNMITRDELIASRAANFSRFDRNSDGMLTNADIPAILRRTAIGQQVETMRMEFDANGDGKVAREEFVSGPTPVFDRADANRDNQLTQPEIDAAKAKAGR
jgi:Ca2+-binding EF-hand superfamily protein